MELKRDNELHTYMYEYLRYEERKTVQATLGVTKKVSKVCTKVGLSMPSTCKSTFGDCISKDSIQRIHVIALIQAIVQNGPKHLYRTLLKEV